MNSFLRNTYQYFYIFTIFFFVILLVNAINGQSIDYQLYLCACCGIVAVAVHAWCYVRRRAALTDNTEPLLDTEETLDLLEEALTALGCQPTTHKSDGKIVVAYQGENILFDVHGDSVRIVDYIWRTVDKNDPDMSAKLLAVNNANEGFLTKLIFWRLEDDNIGISTCLDFILHSGIKRLDLFLNMAMQRLLQSHRILDETYLAMMSTNDKANNDIRRPVGFATADESTNNNCKPEGEQSEDNGGATESNEVKAESSMRRPVGFATSEKGNII